MDIYKYGFYPYDFTSSVTTKTTTSVELTSGNLIIGDTYTILEKPIGGTPAFAGASTLNVGYTFVATDTTAIFGTEITGKLVNISTGVPTEITFYKGIDPVFKWKYLYNKDNYCVSYSITDENNNLIR
jgi:hypothetical protein